MNRYIKISAALAAFALLLVVMGLSTSSSVQAQVGTITVVPKYVCSLPACAVGDAGVDGVATNDSLITVTEGDVEVKITNLDVASVPGNINPRTVPYSGPLTIRVVQEFTDTIGGVGDEGDGIPDNANEIRGFNGNRIQVEYKPTNSQTFATYATIIVDNVKPSLITNSPTTPLISKGSTVITFSADITDGGSGYTTTNTSTAGIHTLTDDAGILAAANGTTDAGGVRLVVAGNVVALANTNFSAIDGGWNVWTEINSSAIQSIGANTPWYFETRDRAGNTRRSSGSIELKPSTVTPTAITVSRFDGNLHGATFLDSTIKVTRGSTTGTLTISGFDGDGQEDIAGDGGIFTVAFDGDSPFADDDDQDNVDMTQIMASDKFELNASNLVTVDSKAPRHVSSTTGTAYSTKTKGPVTGLSAKANSMLVSFGDDGKTDDDSAGSGLDTSSVAPGAFTVSGNSVNAVFVSGNDVYLTLAEKLGPDEQPSVVIASGQIKDKAGNAFGGIRISKAGDGLGPNLSLSKSGDLSKEKVTVTIATDEQLSALPIVTLSRVINSGGGLAGPTSMVCDEGSTDAVETVAVPAVVGGCNSLDEADDGDVDTTEADYTAVLDPRRPDGSRNPSQTAAQSYSYVVTDTAVPGEEIGGKFNVYVTGMDTQGKVGSPNISKIGNSSSANNVGAFTFQVDTELNGDRDPIVKVGEATAEGGEGDIPEVEAIDNLIVTIDFAGESSEYPGDSYRTVDLTLAELTITLQGRHEGEDDVQPDHGRQQPGQHPVHGCPAEPEGRQLQPEGEGNGLGRQQASDTCGPRFQVGTWSQPSRCRSPWQPGWNMISLPFQPGNPAINSVIPSTHPADIVMTFDGPTQTWLVSRRDAESGLFVGDIAVMTASTAYFVRTTNFQDLNILRPPIATNAAPPPQIPALAGGEGLEPDPDREQRLAIAQDDPGGRVLRHTVQLRQRGLVEGDHLQHAGADLGGRDAWREGRRTR